MAAVKASGSRSNRERRPAQGHAKGGRAGQDAGHGQVCAAAGMDRQVALALLQADQGLGRGVGHRSDLDRAVDIETGGCRAAHQPGKGERPAQNMYRRVLQAMVLPDGT